MAFKYEGWTLFSRDLDVKPGVKMKVYFFSKRRPKDGRVQGKVPKGFMIVINPRTGLPFLKSK